jgi:hypothetical protein
VCVVGEGRMDGTRIQRAHRIPVPTEPIRLRYPLPGAEARSTMARMLQALARQLRVGSN